MRAVPWRSCSLIVGETCHTRPVKSLSVPTGWIDALVPTEMDDSASSLRRASISSSPPWAMRNSGCEPPVTVWPTSTLRSRTRPDAGAIMLRRALRARNSRSWACATRVRATAASRWAVSRSTSAVETKPRSTSCSARSRLACARLASACATWILAAALWTCCDWTDWSTLARTWPWRTQSPASKRTAVTRPPSPTTPTGRARRAESVPVAVISPSTVVVPGVTTVTVGACEFSPPAGVVVPPPRMTKYAAIAKASTMSPPIMNRRRLLRRSEASNSSGSPSTPTVIGSPFSAITPDS